VVALAHAAGAIDVDVVDRYLHRIDRVLTRARAAGLVRAELEPRDVAVAVVMVLATVRDDKKGGTRRAATGAATWRCSWTACDPRRPRCRPEPFRQASCRPSAVMTTGMGSLTAPTKVSSGPRLRKASSTHDPSRSRTSLPT
jgi:hypothetical protein